MFEPESTDLYGDDANLTEKERKKLIVASERSKASEQVDAKVALIRKAKAKAEEAILQVRAKVVAVRRANDGAKTKCTGAFPKLLATEEKWRKLQD
ncbi:hypothetical protein ACLOJK_035621 [Asimina triloba]